jgi:hypothetical protein
MHAMLQFLNDVIQQPAAETLQPRNKSDAGRVWVFNARVCGWTTITHNRNHIFLENYMFKRFFVMVWLAMIPAAAMGDCTTSNDAGMVTINVPRGQGAPLTITIPSHANVQPSVQAPFALTGASSIQAPHQYRLMEIGEGGWVQIQTD